MITDLELDHILSRWIAEGDDHLPAEDLHAALRQIDRTHQRRPVPDLRLARGGQRLAAWFSLGTVAAVLALAGAWTATRSVPQDLGSAAIRTLDARWAAGAAAPEVIAFTAVLPPDAPLVYWRAAAYDRFDLTGWSQTVDATTEVGRGLPLLRGSAEVPADGLMTALRATIRPAAFRDSLLLSPGMPTRVDAEAQVRTIGSERWLAAIEVPGLMGYTVDAWPLPAGGAGLIAPDRLRGAGSEYPPELAERYTAVPPAALGPRAREVLAGILSSTPSRDPYDVAVAIESHLRDPGRFTYDVTPPPCDDPSLVECFARTRTGYCLHYASTMAILLRGALPEHRVPTRLVQGFLPGERSGSVETVTNARAHAWVEVYFEGVGWVPFDPTPAGTADVIVDPPSP